MNVAMSEAALRAEIRSLPKFPCEYLECNKLSCNCLLCFPPREYSELHRSVCHSHLRRERIEMYGYWDSHRCQCRECGRTMKEKA